MSKPNDLPGEADLRRAYVWSMVEVVAIVVILVSLVVLIVLYLVEGTPHTWYAVCSGTLGVGVAMVVLARETSDELMRRAAQAGNREAIEALREET